MKSSPDSEVELGSAVDLVVARRPEPQPEPEPEPQPSEPEPSRESATSSDFPDIPNLDEPSRDDEQSKGR